MFSGSLGTGRSQIPALLLMGLLTRDTVRFSLSDGVKDFSVKYMLCSPLGEEHEHPVTHTLGLAWRRGLANATHGHP